MPLSLGLFPTGGCSQAEEPRGPRPAEAVGQREQAIWTERWETVGTGAAQYSTPAIASWGPGRLDVFWRDTNNYLQHAWKVGSGDWTAPEKLAGSIFSHIYSDPAVISTDSGKLDLFWRGPNNRLRHMSYPAWGGGWSSVEELGSVSGTMRSAPSVASWGPGRLDVFWTGTANEIRHVWRPSNGAAWTSEEPLGEAVFVGSGTSPGVSAVSWGSNRIDLFWREQGTNQLGHKWIDPDSGWSWTANEHLGGSLSSAPAASSWGAGRLDVFWKWGSALGHKWKDPATGWSGLEDLGEIHAAGFAAVARPASGSDPRSIHVAAVEGTAVVHKTWVEGAPWHSTPAPGGSPGPDVTLLTGGYGKFWEYSATASSGAACPAGGRAFVSGTGSGIPSVVHAGVSCSSAACATEVIGAVAPQGTNPPGITAMDAIENDSVMTTLADGTVLLARGLTRYKEGYPLGVSGTMIWASSDCGTTWTSRAFIDPTDTARLTYDYGTPQPPPKPGDPPTLGGFDREEVYGDPWTGYVYLTFNARNTTRSDNLILRSMDGGTNWERTALLPGDGFQPFMMTSLPGTLYVFACGGSGPVLSWSHDAGTTWSSTIVNAGNASYGCRSNAGVEGSESVSRIGHFVDDTGRAFGAVRVLYPDIVNGKQVIRVFRVDVTDDGVQAAAVSELDAISDSNADILQATVIESDPAQVGLASGDTTALLFWRQATAVGQTVRAIVLRDTRWSSAMDISSPMVGLLATGHFAKGGAVYDAATRRHVFWVPWVDNYVGDHSELHARTVTVPQ